MSNQSRGTYFENVVKEHLTEAGYCALRSPASKGELDVMAYRHGQALLVQCKTNGACGVAEWNALFDLAERVGAVPILAKRTSKKKFALFRMTARKDGSGKRQPMEEYRLDTPTTTV